MRKVVCCGCELIYTVDNTAMYRGKRWCGSDDCKNIIDTKVKHSNYKKKMRKIENGTYRSGVTPEIRKYILNRDSYCCGKCKSSYSDDRMMQVHHIIPVSEGGTDVRSNLITLCKWCHTDIHERGWENYAESLRKEVEKVEGADKASRS